MRSVRWFYVCLVFPGAMAVLVLAATGCTTYQQQSFWEATQVKAEFEANNFVVQKLGVQGSASCPFLFGIGGKFDLPVAGIATGDPALLWNAMRDLHRNAQMQGRPAFLHNINVEWTRRGVPGLFIVREVTITADVVDFTGEYVDYRSR